MALGRWLATSVAMLSIATAAILPGPFFFILVKRNDDAIRKGTNAAL